MDLVLQIIFTASLRQRLSADGRVTAYALNPGEAMTDVVRSLPSYIGRLYRLLLRTILLTPMEGEGASFSAAVVEQFASSNA